MRIFPRIRRPRLKPIANRLRRSLRHLSVVRVAVSIEWLIFSIILLYALTGGRSAFIDGFGRRADLAALALALGFLAVLHAAVKHYIIPRIERYFSPVRYDERRILFDLGQEARRDEISRRADAWCAGAPQQDDLTFIVLKVKKA